MFVFVKIPVNTTAPQSIERLGWTSMLSGADRVCGDLSILDWSFVESSDTDTIVERFTSSILAVVRRPGPAHKLMDQTGKHSWRNGACRIAIPARSTTEDLHDFDVYRDGFPQDLTQT